VGGLVAWWPDGSGGNGGGGGRVVDGPFFAYVRAGLTDFPLGDSS